jgi:pilus assembly protein CpaB
MRVVTIVSLGASAVLGLGALFVAKVALPNAAAAKAPLHGAPVVGKSMVVASRAIKYGEKLDAGALTVIKVPDSALPAGAFTAVDQVLAADHGGPPVALIPMSPKEPVLPPKLSGPGARPSVAAEVADGMRAYAVKVNDATGVGGHALPGDHVDVVLTRDLTPQGQTRNFISYVVVQNARVLAVDLNADLNSDKPTNPNTYTVEVSVEDSQKLSLASTLGTLSLALRKMGEAEIADAPPLRTGDFLVGGGGASRGGSVIRTSGPPRPAHTGILIVEGESSKRSRAPKKAPSAGGGAVPAGLNAVGGAASATPGTSGLGAASALGAVG